MPIISIPAYGEVEFPDSMSESDIEAAIVKLTGVTPGQKFSAGEVAARSFERRITSSIRGIGQRLGLDQQTAENAVYDEMGNVIYSEPSRGESPVDADLRKEAEARIMAEQRPVVSAIAGLGGTILDPINLLPVGRIATAAQGAAKIAGLGALGGLLEPTYEGDSVSGNIILGAVTGGALGSGLGYLIQKYGKEAVDAAAEAGAKTVDEIEQVIKTKPHIKLKSQQQVDDVIEGTPQPAGKPRITLKPAVDEAGNPTVQLVDTAPKEIVDSIQPLLDGIGDPVEKEAVVLSIAKGDYTKLFNSNPFKDTPISIDRIVGAFSENNPNRIANMDAFIKAKTAGRQESEDLLTQVYTALQTRVASNLGKLNRIDIPEDIAVQTLLDRKVQDLLPADVINGFLPAVRKAKDDLFAINDLMNTLEGSGMTRREAAAILAPDFARAEAVLTAALGNASNTGLALQALKQQAKIIGSTKNILGKVMQTQGDTIDRLLSLSDSFKIIDGTLDDAIDKNAAKAAITKSSLREPNWKDKMGEFIVNGFISGLATPVVNVASAGFKIPAAIATRAIEGVLSKDKRVSEAGAMMYGVLQGLREGLPFAKQGWITSSPIDSITEFKPAIGGTAGEVIRTPTKVSVSVDEWAKAVFRRMEWNALSNRIAYSGQFKGKEAETYNLLRQVNLGDASRIGQGKTSVASWAQKIMDTSEGIGLSKEEAYKLAAQVARFAKRETFQEEFEKGTMAANLLKFRAEHPELAFVIPFVKTPLNIMKDALSYMGATAIPGTYKGLTKEEKIARLAVGSAFVASLGAKVADGTLTGSYSTDPAKRAAAMAAGIPEYSIKIGDTWYSYARLEPIATVLGTTVDGIRTVAEYSLKDPRDRKAAELAKQLVTGFTKNIASKTFLEGISNVLEAIHDPGRYGGSFVNGLAGILVPSFIAAPARSADPSMRVVNTFGEAVANRLPNVPGLGDLVSGVTGGYVPGTRQDLPEQYLLYGGTRPNPASGWSAFTGIQTAPTAQTDLQREAQRVGFDYEMPDKKLKGVELNSQEISRYQELSSNFADPILNGIINNPAYQNLPKARQKVVLENAMKRARALATRQLFMEKAGDPEFRAEVIRKKMQKKGLIDDSMGEEQ